MRFKRSMVRACHAARCMSAIAVGATIEISANDIGGNGRRRKGSGGRRLGGSLPRPETFDKKFAKSGRDR